MLSRYTIEVLRQTGKDVKDFYGVRSLLDVGKVIFPSIFFFLAQVILNGVAFPMNNFIDALPVSVLSLIAGILGTCLFFFLVAPFKIDQKQEDAIRDLEAKNRELIEPKMEIIFEHGTPYEESQPLHDLVIKKVRGTRKLFRGGVHNLSSRTIAGVSVVLKKSEPDIIPTLPLPLHLLHGIGGPTFELNPDETKHFEVITIFEDTDTEGYKDKFAIEHTVSGVSRYNPIQNHRFRIEASGNNVPVAHRYFCLRVGAGGKVYFEPE